MCSGLSFQHTRGNESAHQDISTLLKISMELKQPDVAWGISCVRVREKVACFFGASTHTRLNVDGTNPFMSAKKDDDETYMGALRHLLFL